MTWSLAAEPMWELGRFTPNLPKATPRNQYDVEREIQDQFKTWLKERVDTSWPFAPEIRSPLHHWAMNRPNQRLSWHHDSTGVFCEGHYLVSWSNGLGTEITYDDRKIWQAEPGTVLAFDNKRFKHRTPLTRSRDDVRDRWFARTSLFVRKRATTWDPMIRTSVKDVPGVFGLTT